MNPLRTVCLMMGVLALACANSSGPRPMSRNSNRNSIKNNMKPTSWFSVSSLESLPSVKDVSLEELAKMPVGEGADLINQLYYVSRAGQALEATYAPKPSEIPAFIATPNNQKINFKLEELPSIVKKNPQFGKQKVTIFITGLPQTLESVKEANEELEEAYMQRYNAQTSDEENYTSAGSSSQRKPKGSVLFIKLGETISNLEDYVTLDTEKVGNEIANVLVETLDNSHLIPDNIHLIGANLGANVAGAVGRHYTRRTSHQLPRITGLDPAKEFGRNPETLTGLARGDAEFVDIIHTTSNSMGTSARSGDVDFFPGGVKEAVPGADSVIESSQLAVMYYAETVIPGNERNFPAVNAQSLEDYKNQNGHGKRIYMGINTPRNAEGDFVLQVNTKSPYGRRAPAQKQVNYHNVHRPWKVTSQDYE